MRLKRDWVVVAAGAMLPWLVVGSAEVVWGEKQLTEPIYRVANDADPAENEAAQAENEAAIALEEVPSTTSAVQPAAMTAAATPPFDLTQRPNEHPLAPVIRVSKEILAHIDNDVKDYSCLFEKRERLEGELGEKQVISMKVRQQPFSVYMFFNQPHQGREVLFVDGKNDNEMLVLECGWKRRVMGQMQLDPKGMLAMRGQKYPITKVGIRNLVAETIHYCELDSKFAECKVTTNPNTKIDNRPTTLIQIEHPVPRREFRAYVTRYFIDNELRVPIHFDAYMWPEAPGQAPPLESSYTYRKLAINTDLKASDFDPKNPEIFKP